MTTSRVQGIGEHSPGTSPPIHLSRVEPVATDPQFHALVTTVMMLYLSSEHAEFCFEELHLPRKAIIPRPGPMSVMLARLHQIGWYWSHGTLFLDHWDDPISQSDCPIQELRARLAQGWQQRIQGQAAERKTLKGMSWMSPALTLPTLKSWTQKIKLFSVRV